MRRYGLPAFLGAWFLIPTAISLLGGRSLLAERVTALEAIANEQLVVVDANGTVLGSLVNGMDEDDLGEGRPYQGTVALDVEGLPLLPVHARRRVLFGTIRRVYFASGDCSGTPLFPAVSWDPGQYYAPVLPITVVTNQGSTIFYSDLDANPQISSVGSWFEEPYGYTSDPGAYINVPGFRASLQPFTPPYSVVTRGELAAQ